MNEKERFVTKQYVPIGQPISKSNNTIIYRVKCLAEPGQPEGILKIYRRRNIKALYDTLKKLDYNGWPHIYNVKHFEDGTLVVEELLKGHTLAELLSQNRSHSVTFTEEEVGRIMDQIVEILEELVTSNPPIIHHNLKPSNIFITDTGHVKFLDFIPGPAPKKNPLSSMLHALGGIFHEMLTGKKPTGEKSTYAGQYETILRRCLEKNQAKQYNNVKDIKDDIDYARTHAPMEMEHRTVKIPYTLTMPFHGIILCFEWILAALFIARQNIPTASLFTLAFVIHIAAFAMRRHSFLQKEGVYLDFTKRFGPVFLLAAIFAILFFVIKTFFTY